LPFGASCETTRVRRRASLLLIGACALVLALGGCAKSGSTSTTAASTPTAGETATSTTPNVKFAKTKFLFHAGLALGAFHHFIYKPFKAGDLRHPLLHKVALLKAALAGVFVYHELRLAAQDVRASKLLSTLFAPITLVADKIAGFKTSLATGRASAPQVEGISSELATLSSAAASKGSAISEVVPSVAALAHAPA
jgi:hypothetical protein